MQAGKGDAKTKQNGQAGTHLVTLRGVVQHGWRGGNTDRTGRGPSKSEGCNARRQWKELKENAAVCCVLAPTAERRGIYRQRKCMECRHAHTQDSMTLAESVSSRSRTGFGSCAAVQSS